MFQGSFDILFLLHRFFLFLYFPTSFLTECNLGLSPTLNVRRASSNGIETSSTRIDITDLPEEILTANPGLSNAVPDDGGDDAGAIQAAIDWLAGRREAGFTAASAIYIPAGTFDLGKTLEVNVPNLIFEGAGTQTAILQNADTFRVGLEGLPDSGVDVESVNRDAYLFDLGDNADDVTFRKMTLTGPAVHGAIFGFQADGLEIDAVKFEDFVWSAVRIFVSNNVEIHDSLFVDAGGRAKGAEGGPAGGSIYATYLSDSEIYNNRIARSEGRDNNVFGIKGRQFKNTRIHHNTIDTNFAIELPFENDRLVEIDHNFLGGTVSIPKHAGGAVPEDGLTFHIHHNYFTTSYALEWARNGTEIHHNVFVFDTEEDGGNLISGHGDEPASGQTEFHNNLILNPGRGIFWNKGIYNHFSFYNNEIVANETATPRTEGLFGFNSETDFSTIAIRDNVIEVKGISRPLMRNEADYGATIANNTLSNISDRDRFENPDTGEPRGLLEPLVFRVGADGEFAVDGFEIAPTDGR